MYEGHLVQKLPSAPFDDQTHLKSLSEEELNEDFEAPFPIAQVPHNRSQPRAQGR